MALIVCIECRKEVSDKAEKCPHCGARIAPVAVASCWTPVTAAPARRGVFRVARYLLLVVVLCGAWWGWQAATSNRKAPFSAGLAAAFRGPRKIADARVALKAGDHVSYAFALDTDSRVHVRVTAVTGPVDMMLLSKADAERFRIRGGELFGGAFSGVPSLASRQVGMLDKTEVVAKGEWSLVVLRPKDVPAGEESAPAEIAVTVY